MDSSPPFPPPPPRSWNWQRRQRIFSGVVARVTDPSNVFALACSGSVVYGIGFFESWLRCAPLHPAKWRFCASAAFSNILPSVIWLSASHEDVAKRPWVRAKMPAASPAGTGGSDIASLFRRLPSALRRRIFFLQCLRSVIAGFVGIGQLLNLVTVFDDVSEDFNQKVCSGSEPLMNDKALRGRVIRLAGRSSDCTELGLRRQKTLGGVVPIYEPNAAATKLLRDVSDGGRFPIGWTIGNGRYGSASSWEGFRPDRSWLFPVSPSSSSSSSSSASAVSASSQKAKELLIVEADSSVGEEALALIEDESDLSLTESSQAFSMLRRLAVAAGVVESPNQVMRVLLTDVNKRVKSGSGNVVTQKTFVQERNEADVIISARAPLIASVLDQIGQEARQGGRLVFDTSNSSYYESMKKLLAQHGVSVLDRHDPEATTSKKQNSNSSSPSKSTTRLVYENTTAETIVAAESILRAGIVDDKSRLVLLLDNARGVAELESAGLDGCRYICSAAIYEDLFARVRHLATADGGLPYEEIQKIIDEETKC